MSDEKGLFDEEKEVVEPMKNEPSSIEEEEMTEEKVAFERSDRGELMISYNTWLLYQSYRDASYIVPWWSYAQ